MKKNLRYFMTLLLMMVASVGWGQTTVSMTSFTETSGYVNDDENISYEAAKGSASTAPAVNNNEIRVYQNGGTFTVSANNGSKINSITLGSSMATTVTYKVDDEEVSTNQSIDANGTITVSNLNASSVLFTCTGTTKTSRLYVNNLSVTYTSSGATPTCATPTFSPAAGAVAAGTEVTITCATEGATIHYTLDGNEPTVESSIYTSAIKVNEETTIKAIAVKTDCNNSAVATAIYTILNSNIPFNETFNEIKGTGGRDNTFTGTVGSSSTDKTDETWTTLGENGAFQCIKLGTSKAEQSATTGEIKLNGSGSLTFSAAGWGSGTNTLTVTAEGCTTITGDTNITLKNGEWSEYTVNIEGANGNLTLTFTMKRGFLDDVKVMKVEAPTVATPTFSVLAGSYDEPQTVEITCDTEGAKIYYTLDGTTPTEESTEYTGKIIINNTTTLKAIAIKDGKSSYVASATYTLPTTCANIAAMNALDNGTEFKFNGKVTVVYANGSYVYIKDDTGSSLLFKGGLGVEKGDIINAGWEGKVSIFYNLFEVVPSTALVSEEKAEVTYPVATTAEVTKANMNKVVVLKGVTYGEINDKNFKIGSDIAGFNQFGIDIPEAEEGATYDIEGVISVFKENVQFQPISITKVESSAETEEVPVNQHGKGTYVTTNALDFTGITTVTAYVATAQNGSDVTFDPVTKVPAGTPLLVKGATTDVPVIASAEEIGTNFLVAGSGEGVASVAGGKYNFILNYLNGAVGFYRAAENTVAKDRAYLSLDSDIPTGSAKVNLIFSDEATGINNVNAVESTNEKVYNLAGQQMKSTVKGVYIKNGRKYVK